MRKIDFSKRVEQIEIAGKVYEIELSNYEFIKKAQDSLDKFTQAQEALKDGKIDSLLDSAKMLVDFMLGDFDRIWEEAHHDIYNLMDLCIILSEVVKEGLEYKVKQYV